MVADKFGLHVASGTDRAAKRLLEAILLKQLKCYFLPWSWPRIVIIFQLQVQKQFLPSQGLLVLLFIVIVRLFRHFLFTSLKSSRILGFEGKQKAIRQLMC